MQCWKAEEGGDQLETFIHREFAIWERRAFRRQGHKGAPGKIEKLQIRRTVEIHQILKKGQLVGCATRS